MARGKGSVYQILQRKRHIEVHRKTLNVITVGVVIR